MHTYVYFCSRIQMRWASQQNQSPWDFWETPWDLSTIHLQCLLNDVLCETYFYAKNGLPVCPSFSRDLGRSSTLAKFCENNKGDGGKMYKMHECRHYIPNVRLSTFFVLKVHFQMSNCVHLLRFHNCKLNLLIFWKISFKK